MDSSQVDEVTASNEAQFHHKIFRKELIKRSNNSIFELCCKEWDYSHSETADSEDGGKCICTKDIIKLNYVRNKYNGNVAIIGCDCLCTMEHIDKKMVMANMRKQVKMRDHPELFCKVCNMLPKKKVKYKNEWACKNCNKNIWYWREQYTYRTLLKERPNYVKQLLKSNYYSLTQSRQQYVDYIREFRIKK